MGWAVALAAVAAATSAAGMISQGEAASRAASYQAQVARNNAITAEQNAQYASKAGEAEALDAGIKGSARLSHIKAAQAANGLDVNSGSAVDVRSTEALGSRLDVLRTRQNAALQAYGYRTQGTNQTAQAGLYQNEADSVGIGADLGAVGGLLGQASSLVGKYGGGGGYTPSVDKSYDWSVK